MARGEGHPVPLLPVASPVAVRRTTRHWPPASGLYRPAQHLPDGLTFLVFGHSDLRLVVILACIMLRRTAAHICHHVAEA